MVSRYQNYNSLIRRWVPSSIRSKLSGTIIEDFYKSLQIHTTKLETTRFNTPVASFDMKIPTDHSFGEKNGEDKHEPILAEEIRNNANEDTVFYDIGARFGYHTVLMKELGLPESHIHAFEADKLFFHVLKKNHSKSANLNQAFVSDRKGGLSLDTYTRSHNDPTMIKIDVEGAEAQVIRGSKATLSSNPMLFIEVHPHKMEEFGDNIDQLLKFLKKQNYTLEIGDHRLPDGNLQPLNHADLPTSTTYLLKASK